MFMYMQYTKPFRRIRGVFQIMMTLVSFFGFNEAVLAERYRSSLYIKNDNTRMIVVKSPMTEPIKLNQTVSGYYSELVNPAGLIPDEDKTKVVALDLHSLVF
ncbi:hypothetical protein GZ77_15385 [Endozoicomonas montiporae]|uniref:Uncharacterized protein n=2 Tax=Endozoicomonas montiporae TaxID=1027273 RepID=A0A081N5G2_9GAMM|nr:hypothetical protein [Endozoicomonas montiporae]AMO57430.1 hypothetical protein EZMO1_3440 [Endozoicomonas montiporae CL-33]KEQ13685.1 hypothetical protein GZ77_15385 [Endozoicomonas montiporae]